MIPAAPPFVGAESMYALLLDAVEGVAGIFGILLVLIIVNKGWRELRERSLHRRREYLEQKLFRYVMASDPLESYLPAPFDPGDWPAIEGIFFDLTRVAKGSVRTRARAAFEKLGIVDHYLERLRSRRWWIRAEACEKLGLIGSDRSIAPLVEHLSDSIPEVRFRASQALGSIGTSESLRPLVLALKSPGRWSAIRVSVMLVAAGDEAVNVLLEEFQWLPDQAKLSAVDIFARIRSLRASPLLRELLTDPNPDLRARAANALGMLGDPTVAPLLVRAMEDPEWPVRAMAAKSLGHLREQSSIDALKAALADSQWWVRANAAEALKAKGISGREALIQMLDSDDPYAAQQAVQMLQESGVLDHFIGMLVSSVPGEQTSALGLMAKLVKLRRVDLLTEAAREHPDRVVRQRLATLLGTAAEA
ncbi:MAG TPA: HEAT repeat domain-containing protein [Candidatus Saccharimonadales bacterium]|nr:HEAT repeat domain-containing protein [Candidatus Saccharimonadales bacterium]